MNGKKRTESSKYKRNCPNAWKVVFLDVRSKLFENAQNELSFELSKQWAIHTKLSETRSGFDLWMVSLCSQGNQTKPRERQPGIT